MSQKVRAVDTIQTSFGRWLIVLPVAHSWAWSGSRWVEHHNGVSREAQVANFATQDEAMAYAMEHLLGKGVAK